MNTERIPVQEWTDEELATTYERACDERDFEVAQHIYAEMESRTLRDDPGELPPPAFHEDIKLRLESEQAARALALHPASDEDFIFDSLREQGYAPERARSAAKHGAEWARKFFGDNT